MAALNFPDVPVIGDTFGSAGNIWRWDGTRWASTAGTSGVRGEVAYAQITANIAGYSTTPTDIYGLRAVFNIVPGRRYKVTGDVYVYSSAAGDHAVMALTDDGGAQQQSDQIQMPVAGTVYKLHIEWAFTGLVAVSYAFKLRLNRGAGSGTLTVSAGQANPAFIQVEDITYETGLPTGNYGDPAGRIEDYIGTSAPPGWLAMIGQAVLNADTTYPNLWAVPGLPGKSGTTLTLPDTRGRVTTGLNTSDTAFDVIGETGGSKTHTLATTELPAHTHVQDSHIHTSPAHGHTWQGVNNTAGVSAQAGLYPFRMQEDTAVNWPGSVSMIGTTAVGINGATATNQNTGGGLAHNNLQPYITFLKIIRAY